MNSLRLRLWDGAARASHLAAQAAKNRVTDRDARGSALAEVVLGRYSVYLRQVKGVSEAPRARTSSTRQLKVHLCATRERVEFVRGVMHKRARAREIGSR